MTADALPGTVGFAVAQEKSSDGSEAIYQTTTLLENWPVSATKRLGSSAQ